jgi:Calx-beta domain/Bacterial Ig domain
MLSQVLWAIRAMRVTLILAFLAGILVAPGALNAQSPSAPGNPNVYLKPYPAPALPSAGGTFADPTFGTTILRITDPSNAPSGASVNSAAQDSMFNSDGSLFYLHLRNAEGNSRTVLYALEPTTQKTGMLGTLPTAQGLAYDGARWDPSNPSILYAVVTSSVTRQLWQLTLPLPGTAVLLHDFSKEIPAGGYPYSRVQVSPDSRYFAITASSGAFGVGQDAYDYVVVWDRLTGAAKVLNTAQRLGTPLHSMVLDNSGQYAIVERGDWTGSYIWHWPSDTLSARLGVGLPDAFGGHKIPGDGQIISPGPDAGQWVLRSLATPARFSTILVYPKKNGRGNWFEDSHSSRLLRDGSFVQARYAVGLVGGNSFQPFQGSVYRLPGYLKLSSGLDVPTNIRFKGVELQQVTGIPNAPGTWSYDGGTDTLFLWLPGNVDPRSAEAYQPLAIFDWRPLMEEIVQLSSDGASWTWRRLAHHRTQYTGVWATTPRANADPTGRFVLFKSNWDKTLRNADGSDREDAFLLLVPSTRETLPTAKATPPSVSLLSPTAGTTLVGSVNVAVKATDSSGIATLKYQLDGAPIAVFSPPSLTLTWDSRSTPNGPHTLTATAIDKAGNTAQASVSFTVSNVIPRRTTVVLPPTTVVPRPTPPPPSSVFFTNADYRVDASKSAACITVVRSGPRDVKAAINYATSDGTAKAGVEYAAALGTLTFTPGVTTQKFKVQILQRALAQAKTLNLTLSNPSSGGAVGAPSVAALTIVPDGNTRQTARSNREWLSNPMHETDTQVATRSQRGDDEFQRMDSLISRLVAGRCL